MLERLFPPTCPCDPAAKAWVEDRLRWLCGQFDEHVFNGRPLVLPTHAFFPEPHDGSRRAARALLGRVCAYMGVDRDRVTLEFVSHAGRLWLVNEAGQYLPHAAGTYQETERHFLVRIDTSGLDDPMTLVGTMAHELAHARLLGEGRATSDQYDNELLTDLTVVFLGLGVFLANVPRTWDSQYTKWPGTELKKPEYMTRPMFGYALAHLAWFRGEERPAWANHLHWNARPDFKQAVRFLFRTGDSAFRPERFRSRAGPGGANDRVGG